MYGSDKQLNMASDHYHDLLLDYVYGLLDNAEAESIRAHVETCADCRVALAEAETQKQLLGRAARVVREVPLFASPGQGPEAATPVAVDEQGPTATLPVPATKPAKSPWRRYWPAWAAAAAVLAA